MSAKLTRRDGRASAPATTLRGTAREGHLEQLDRLIFATAEQQQLSGERAAGLICDAYARHLDSCPAFAAFVERMGGGAHELSPTTLDLLPLLPIGAYKGTALRGIEDVEHGLHHTSSGTRGRKSTVHRDGDTLMRLLGSLDHGFRHIGDWFAHEVEVVNLGPAHEQAGELWFAYIMSLVELLFDCVSTTDLDVAAERLREALARSPHVFLVGPPFLVRDLAMHFGAGPPRGAERLWVLTGGGWKDHVDTLGRDQLETLLGERLGVARERYRDAFNQVELNTVFVECEAHEKHVPPWVRATARDPSTLRRLPSGELGLLAYMDASATSYPAFFVGDDVGVVSEGECACGQHGQRVAVLRRVITRQQRGCAAEMVELIEQAQ